MASKNQVLTDEHPLLIARTLHESIPTQVGLRWMEWLSNPEGSPPSFDVHSIDSSNFSDEYLFAELLSKADFLPIHIDKRLVAIKSFQSRELVNAEVNTRLANLYLPVNDPAISAVIRRHKRYMRRVLGSFARYSKAAIAAAYFGPGTNVGVRYGKSSLYDKVTCKRLTCTAELAPYALSIVNENDFLARALLGADGVVSLLSLQVKVIPGAKLAFVPKNAKTDRSITVEPLLNSFFQNGLGKVLRGIISHRTTLTLDDQRRNQIAARIGVRDGLATVDLKDASNSLTTELVRGSLSLCPGWFHALDIARSKAYTCESIDNSVHMFQLFAGMGNGFTFPLESLIFYSLAKAVVEVNGGHFDPIVYGDDIILPSTDCDLLERVFAHVGLVVNASKTHKSGGFRESCGKHYFDGIDVSPFYIKTTPCVVQTTKGLDVPDPRWYFTVYNGLWKWACRDGFTFDTRVLSTLKLIRELCRGPTVHPDLGDVGYFPLGDRLSKTGVREWTCVVQKTAQFHYEGSKGYWCALHQALAAIDQDRPSYGKYSKRGGKVKIKRQRVVHCDYRFTYIPV